MWKPGLLVAFQCKDSVRPGYRAKGSCKDRQARRARSHLVVAKGGTLKDVSIGVTPAASPVDALAAAAGEEAVPAREAAEATAEKAGAAAEQQNEAEVKDKAEVRRPLRAVWVGYTAWWDAAIGLGVQWPLCLSSGPVCGATSAVSLLRAVSAPASAHTSLLCPPRCQLALSMTSRQRLRRRRQHCLHFSSCCRRRWRG